MPSLFAAMAPEESKELATKSSNPEAGSTCQVCKTKPSKYKCPGCCVRTCSLPCVKAHKESTGCNGKRQLTQFVPLDSFDDNLLISGNSPQPLFYLGLFLFQGFNVVSYRIFMCLLSCPEIIVFVY